MNKNFGYQIQYALLDEFSINTEVEGDYNTEENLVLSFNKKSEFIQITKYDYKGTIFYLSWAMPKDKYHKYFCDENNIVEFDASDTTYTKNKAKSLYNSVNLSVDKSHLSMKNDFALKNWKDILKNKDALWHHVLNNSKNKPNKNWIIDSFKNSAFIKNEISNATPKSKYEYWVEGHREVEPLHNELQTKFINYLSQKGYIAVPDTNSVDVQYIKNGKNVLVEIKPTKNIKTKYAIRIAVGQILEYQYINDKSAELEIVIGNKPKTNEKDFVLSLGINLTFFDKQKNTFIEYHCKN